MSRQDYKEKRPAWSPKDNPVKVKCPGNRVYGWVYPDGTLEIICRERMCSLPGHETRHLINPLTGESFPVYVPNNT